MFGFGKKKLTPQEEWQADVKAAMASPETACKQDIAEMLWEKYKKLADNIHSREDFQRVYDLIGQTVANFQWPLEALMWMGDVCESLLRKPDQAAHWFKTAADLGNPQGARNYADLAMSHAITVEPPEVIKYYQQASDGGIVEASFMFGEIWRAVGNKVEALLAYRRAADKGYSPAQKCINQMFLMD